MKKSTFSQDIKYLENTADTEYLMKYIQYAVRILIKIQHILMIFNVERTYKAIYRSKG